MLLQHLAFLDLAYLSGHSRQRRQEVYSLSQPGGHPHTWRALCSACLQQLEALAAQVRTAHLAALATLPVQNLSADKIFSTVGRSWYLVSHIFSVGTSWHLVSPVSSVDRQWHPVSPVSSVDRQWHLVSHGFIVGRL